MGDAFPRHSEVDEFHPVGPDDLKRVVRGLLRATLRVGAITAAWIALTVLIGASFSLYRRSPETVFGIGVGLIAAGTALNLPGLWSRSRRLVDWSVLTARKYRSRPKERSSKPFVTTVSSRRLIIVVVLVLVAITVGLFGLVIDASENPEPPVVENEESPRIADGPFDPPEFSELELPAWLVPFEPVGRVPLWTQAAIVSAAIAGLVFVVPIISRWLWNLGVEAEPTEDKADHPSAS